MMYFSEYDIRSSGRIEKASLTGEDRVVIIDDLGVASAMYLDIASQTLYWTDAWKFKVEKSDVNGQNRVVLVEEGLELPYSLTFASNNLYFSDETDRYSIKTVSASGGDVSILFTLPDSSFRQIFGLQAIGPYCQQAGKYLCEKRRSFLCLYIIWIWRPS